LDKVICEGGSNCHTKDCCLVAVTNIGFKGRGDGANHHVSCTVGGMCLTELHWYGVCCCAAERMLNSPLGLFGALYGKLWYYALC